MEIPIQDDVYIWANYSVSSYLNFIPTFWNVLIWLKYDITIFTCTVFMYAMNIQNEVIGLVQRDNCK